MRKRVILPESVELPRGRTTYKNRSNTKWLQQATSEVEELLMLHLGSSANRPNVSINGKLVPIELDTGAAVSIVSLNAQMKYFHNVKVNKFNVVLCTYTSEKMLQ